MDRLLPPSAGIVCRDYSAAYGGLPSLASIGIDIGKEVFHIVGFGTDGKIAFRRKIKRLALAETFRSCHLVWWSEWRHASARTLSAGPCGSLVMS